MRSLAGVLSLGAALALGAPGLARADSVADFYQGKRITLYIGSSTGGGDRKSVV